MCSIENSYKEVYESECHDYKIGGDIKIYSVDQDGNVEEKIIPAELNCDPNIANPF